MKIDGVNVANARKKLKIEIIALDVSTASKKKPECCAIANACKRQFSIKEIRVHLGRIYMRESFKQWTRYMTPKAQRDEIIAFDRGGSFEPGIYTLPPPQKAKRTGKRQGTKTNQHISVRKRKRHIVANVRPHA